MYLTYTALSVLFEPCLYDNLLFFQGSLLRSLIKHVEKELRWTLPDKE